MYAKTHPVNYNYAKAQLSKLNYKKAERNPDAILFLNLKNAKKLPKGVKTYKDFIKKKYESKIV